MVDPFFLFSLLVSNLQRYYINVNDVCKHQRFSIKCINSLLKNIYICLFIPTSHMCDDKYRWDFWVDTGSKWGTQSPLVIRALGEYFPTHPAHSSDFGNILWYFAEKSEHLVFIWPHEWLVLPVKDCWTRFSKSMAKKCYRTMVLHSARPNETASVKLMSVSVEISWAKFGMLKKQKNLY